MKYTTRLPQDEKPLLRELTEDEAANLPYIVRVFKLENNKVVVSLAHSYRANRHINDWFFKESREVKAVEVLHEETVANKLEATITKAILTKQYK